MSMGMVKNNQYNIGHICTRQQCDLGLGDKVAMRWVSPALERTDYTFADLERYSNRFANLLSGLGFGSGDVLFTFLPKCPEQFFAFLGSLKVGCITGTLFSNFGEDALLDRLGDSQTGLIVTRKHLYRKVERIRGQLNKLKTVILTDIPDHISDNVLSWQRLMDESDDNFTTPLTSADTASVLHYTSGSTGKPKGVVHRHGSIVQQSRTASEILGLEPEDIFWCTADQGWVTGTSYGIIGPWSLGITQVHFGGGYDPAQWFSLLQNEQVSVWWHQVTERGNLPVYQAHWQPNGNNLK